MDRPAASEQQRLSVCICTYRRPERLLELLQSLVAQSRLPDQVVVVDNDRAAAGKAACEAEQWPFPLVTEFEPEQNISLARNRAVHAADGDWLALIDDDEIASPDWLAGLLAAAREHAADGVLGPVLPLVPEHAPGWIRAGDFYSRRRFTTGTTVPLNELRTSNLLVRRSALLAEPGGPFDPAFGLSGGEDGDLLTRVAQRGARFVWCDEATVSEPVECARLNLGWLLMRSLRGRQDFAMHFLAGRYGTAGPMSRLLFALKALLALMLSSLLALLMLPAGRHRAAYWLRKAYAQLGKLLAFSRFRYREYARVPT